MTSRDFEERTNLVLFDRNRTRPSEAVTIPEFAEMDFLVGTSRSSADSLPLRHSTSRFVSSPR
jgi:hypothetical protein